MTLRFGIPEIGRTVHCVTAWNDDSTARVLGHTLHTSEGIIQRSEPWFDPDWFAIRTKNIYHPVAIIDINRVVELRYLNGDQSEVAKVEKRETIKRTWTVQGSKQKQYIVSQNNDIWLCTCPGFHFRQNCHHVRDVKSALEEARVASLIQAEVITA